MGTACRVPWTEATDIEVSDILVRLQLTGQLVRTDSV